VNGFTTVTDAMQNVSYNYYDPQLRVVKIVDNLGNVQNFEYDTNNNRTKVVDKHIISVEGRNGYVTTYGYDRSGMLSPRPTLMEIRR